MYWSDSQESLLFYRKYGREILLQMRFNFDSPSLISGEANDDRINR
jgi:hypothetical protein